MSNVENAAKADLTKTEIIIRQLTTAAPMTAIIIAFALGVLLGHFL